jgi:hypothetical protein
MKIDCEGCEYEIFNEMEKNNLFDNVEVVMMEWHFRGKKQLLDILKKHSFVSFLKDSINTGIICAVKTNKR